MCGALSYHIAYEGSRGGRCTVIIGWCAAVLWDFNDCPEVKGHRLRNLDAFSLIAPQVSHSLQASQSPPPQRSATPCNVTSLD